MTDLRTKDMLWRIIYGDPTLKSLCAFIGDYYTRNPEKMRKRYFGMLPPELQVMIGERLATQTGPNFMWVQGCGLENVLDILLKWLLVMSVTEPIQEGFIIQIKGNRDKILKISPVKTEDTGCVFLLEYSTSKSTELSLASKAWDTVIEVLKSFKEEEYDRHKSEKENLIDLTHLSGVQRQEMLYFYQSILDLAEILELFKVCMDIP